MCSATVVEWGFRRAYGGRSGVACSADGRQGVEENPDHEEVPGRPAISRENMREQAQEGREQRAEEGRGDRVTRARLFFERLFGRR